MSIEIREVDVLDAAQLDPWYDVYAVAERHGQGAAATVWQLEEVRVMMQDRGSRYRSLAFSGLVDGAVVAAGYLRLPLLDNPERADLAVHVLPGHRRQGHATAVLAHLEQVAREHGRTVLLGESHYAHAAGAEGRGEPGPEFARARGYELALGEVQRVLDLRVDEALLDRLAADAADHHPAYTLRSWVGPVPEDLLQGWAELTASLATEAPTGDLAIEPEAADPAAVREAEEVVARQGRTKYNTVALDAGGTLVGYTDLATTVHEPGRAYQWGTLVRRADRGHRLGIALKVANLRLLQRERPDIEQVVTYNAEVNDHMIGINELLGFRPVARLGEFQKRL